MRKIWNVRQMMRNNWTIRQTMRTNWTIRQMMRTKWTIRQMMSKKLNHPSNAEEKMKHPSNAEDKMKRPSNDEDNLNHSSKDEDKLNHPLNNKEKMNHPSNDEEKNEKWEMCMLFDSDFQCFVATLFKQYIRPRSCVGSHFTVVQFRGIYRQTCTSNCSFNLHTFYNTIIDTNWFLTICKSIFGDNKYLVCLERYFLALFISTTYNVHN